MSEMVRVRLAWVDAARGIGIILVVVGHVLRGLSAGGMMAEGPAFRFADSWIYSFHMPLFFVLSGLFAGRQIGLGPAEFLKNKLATIAYPYLVWSVLQSLVQVAMSRHSNHKVTLGEIPSVLLYPVMQFWFLYALFLISLFYYVVRKCRIGSIGALAICAVLWSTADFVPLGGWWPLGWARAHAISYALGAVIHDLGWPERIERAPTAVLAAIAAAGYGIIAAWVSQPRAAPAAVSLTLSLCGIASTIALATLLSRVRAAEFVRVLGFFSLEIYVAHTIASAGARVVLLKALKVHDPAVQIAVGTLAGLALPVGLAWLCRRYHAEFLFRLPTRRPGPMRVASDR